MKQTKITTNAGLINQGGLLVGAATSLGAALGLHHSDKDKINADLTALIMGVGAHEETKAVLVDRRTDLKTAAIAARAYLRKSRDLFKPFFGYSYSDLWNVLGYNDSLEISEQPEDQQAKLQALRTYYTNHPTYEVPLLNLTAADTQAVIDALTAAQNAVAAQEGAVEAAIVARDDKANKMRTRISMLINELNQLMGPLDPRWLNFGLNMPGADETPDQVVGVTATLIGPTAVAMKWEPSARAQYYRIWTKLHGSPDNYVAVGSPGDLDFTIENLPPNSSIDIVITAVNNGGESPLSQVVTITTQA